MQSLSILQQAIAHLESRVEQLEASLAVKSQLLRSLTSPNLPSDPVQGLDVAGCV